jgi:hypothetical protein
MTCSEKPPSTNYLKIWPIMSKTEHETNAVDSVLRGSLRMGEGTLLNTDEMISSHVVNLKIGGGRDLLLHPLLGVETPPGGIISTT